MDDRAFKAYDIDACVVEIYDQTETQMEDVRFLRELIGTSETRRVLEPFCGNGRILIPLARDGHQLVGMDKSKPMLASVRNKIEQFPIDIRARISLIEADVSQEAWPRGFDYVILGGNSLYELARPEEQERCIRYAARSLQPGGYLYLDNNHMEGDLDPAWYVEGVQENSFPTGVCSDGTVVKGSMETVACDIKKRITRFRRTVEIRTPDGHVTRRSWIEQKHPPSTEEMHDWLTKSNFEIVHLWGNRKKTPYTDDAGRAVFWARLKGYGLTTDDE
jgi:SAM-dependent methyltransferase